VERRAGLDGINLFELKGLVSKFFLCWAVEDNMDCHGI
jgi:hypothetical protein